VKAIRRDVLDPTIAVHSGRVVKVMGDGVLVEFASAVDAVACAIEIQKHVREHDAVLSGGDPIRLDRSTRFHPTPSSFARSTSGGRRKLTPSPSWPSVASG
jgi:hypothetical protein